MIYIVSIGLVALFMAGMAVRLYTQKNGEFRGTCASQNPFLQKEGVTCGYCGKNTSECPNK